ncbi:hypothetical protein A7982_13621 [Minicystis rosea]|nr:hypothetical protein A7982_13621 [Minicystis rosea]
MKLASDGFNVCVMVGMALALATSTVIGGCATATGDSTSANHGDESSASSSSVSSSTGSVGGGGNGGGAQGTGGETASGGGQQGSGGTAAAGGGQQGTGGGGGGTLQSSWYEPPPAINNDPECINPTYAYPLPGNEGQLYAVRLTPPSYPYKVTDVHYELAGIGDCDSSAPHRVEFSVGSGVAPSNTPNLVAKLDIPTGDAAASFRVVKKNLPSPIILQAGEQLFVAVSLTWGTSCIAACHDAEEADRDYWSNATQAPYDWATLMSYGTDTHARIGVNGSTM